MLTASPSPPKLMSKGLRMILNNSTSIRSMSSLRRLSTFVEARSSDNYSTIQLHI